MPANFWYLAPWTTGCVAGVVAAIVVLRARRALAPATVMALGVAWGGLYLGAKWHYRLEFESVPQALLISPAAGLDPGMRLPLGLLTGALLAGLWCLMTRAPWRETGDALAVAASTLIPIGRIGCLVAGCCGGTVCGRWALLCWRYGPGTESFSYQVRAGLIPSDSVLSQPAHPLPLYFALASLLTLGILVWLLRRGAPAGALLLAFGILRPLAKLSLEPLRAFPRPPGLMIGIPASVLVCSVAAIIVWRFRQASIRRLQPSIGASAALVIALVMCAEGALSAAVAPQPDSTAPSAWAAALARYARDPWRARGALRILRRQDPALLPTPMLMAVADSYLRAQKAPQASAVFAQVLEREPGEPWNAWAHLGLGWAALAQGDSAGARAHYAQVAEAGTPSSAVARLVGALIDAGDGRTMEAARGFERIAADGHAAPGLRQAAALGVAYAHYWGGDYGDAAAAFDEVAVSTSAALADDARYGAARARFRAGDESGALSAFRELAGEPGRDRVMRRISDRLVQLDRDAVVSAAFARYRRAPLSAPEQQFAALFDLDGGALARAALRRLEEPTQTSSEPPAAHVVATDVAFARLAEGAEASPPRDARSATPPSSSATSRPIRSGSPLVLMLLAAIVLAALGWALNRGYPGGGRKR